MTLGNRRFRLNIWHGLAAVAVCALACRWPERFGSAAAAVIGGYVTLGTLLGGNKAGRRAVELILVAVMIGCLAMLLFA